MGTRKESFWEKSSFAFVGHTSAKGFPKLSYKEARKLGKRVFAVDPSVAEMEGDPVFENLGSLPESVDAVVLEVPRNETEARVREAADLGIHDVWIHMGRETPEALALAEQRGLQVFTGSCAVMYLSRGFSVHGLHRVIDRLRGNY